MCKKFLKNGKKISAKKIKKTSHIFRQTKIWSIIFLALITVGGLGYLGLVNYKATVGFKISELEIKIDQLKEINQQMQIEKVELQKISRIQEAATKISMVAANGVEYLQSGEE